MVQSSVRAELATPEDPVSAELRGQVVANHIIPLWESGTTAFSRAEAKAFHWPWQVMGPIMRETAKINVPSILERRVMMMVNPTIPNNTSETCSGLISAGIQALMPGEIARPHRHSMHAIRFVLEGEGAETVVEGKPCPMQPGDLVVTPAWTWHEHRNTAGKPTIWVDMLDAAIHRALGNDAFQPGPPGDMRDVLADAAYYSPGFLPVAERVSAASAADYSPVFRYPLAEAQRAVAVAPLNARGSRMVRYVNPVTGGTVLPTIDCYLHHIDEGVRTGTVKSPANQVCVVVSGKGESVIGGVTIGWSSKDVFTIPRDSEVSHSCLNGPAQIFIASDREIYARLGDLVEGDGVSAV